MSTRDVNQMLYGILASDSTLQALGSTGAFSIQAPENQPVPYVVFSKSDGEHSYVLMRRAYQTQTFLVKAITLENQDLAEQMSDRIDALLNLTRPSIASGYTMDIRHDSDVSYAERLGGSTYYHVGGLYKVMVGDA
jgi:hypothetical protein